MTITRFISKFWTTMSVFVLIVLGTGVLRYFECKSTPIIICNSLLQLTPSYYNFISFVLFSHPSLILTTKPVSLDLQETRPTLKTRFRTYFKLSTGSYMDPPFTRGFLVYLLEFYPYTYPWFHVPSVPSTSSSLFLNDLDSISFYFVDSILIVTSRILFTFKWFYYILMTDWIFNV